MNRRDFILAGGTLAALSPLAAIGGETPTSAANSAAPNSAAPDASAAPQPAKLIVSPPALQNAAETSVGVAFAVSADASGWVEYSESPDLADARRAYSGEHGLMDIDDEIALVRLTGLKPATTYHYRIGADRISFKDGYSMKNLGSEVDPTVHSFTTLGAAATGSFCVINDTHDRKNVCRLAFDKIAELKPQVVLWNGDASNTSETRSQAIGVFITPGGPDCAFSSDIPYMFLNGNHDFRGRYNRRLGGVAMFREPTERKPEYAELGRNFVQRLGDIALIGLDTGEDKLDTNRHFAGLFKMGPYREKQALWLAEAIETEAVKTARFKIAFCHIPLFDANPRANPGDIAPDDEDFTRFKTNYAVWQRTCLNLWGLSLKKAGVQLVITGHQHRYRYDPATPDRPWDQIVGGGPQLGVRVVDWQTRRTEPAPEKFPTVIEGRVIDGTLRITVHNLMTGSVVAVFDYKPGTVGAAAMTPPPTASSPR